MTDTTQLIFLDSSSVLLAGYRMKLSKKEYEMLAVLQEQGSPSRLNFSGSTPVLVCSINKKARRICGRKLIIFSNERYMLNPYL